jgi:hypothetical protein
MAWNSVRRHCSKLHLFNHCKRLTKYLSNFGIDKQCGSSIFGKGCTDATFTLKMALQTLREHSHEAHVICCPCQGLQHSQPWNTMASPCKIWSTRLPPLRIKTKKGLLGRLDLHAQISLPTSMFGLELQLTLFVNVTVDIQHVGKLECCL